MRGGRSAVWVRVVLVSLALGLLVLGIRAVSRVSPKERGGGTDADRTRTANGPPRPRAPPLEQAEQGVSKDAPHALKTFANQQAASKETRGPSQGTQLTPTKIVEVGNGVRIEQYGDDVPVRDGGISILNLFEKNPTLARTLQRGIVSDDLSAALNACLGALKYRHPERKLDACGWALLLHIVSDGETANILSVEPVSTWPEVFDEETKGCYVRTFLATSFKMNDALDITFSFPMCVQGGAQ